VGELQLEVLQHRMASEYRVDVRLTRLPFRLARWITGDLDADAFRYSDTTQLVEDRDGRPVLLFRAEWAVDLVLKNHPDLQLSETAAAIE
jgi:peptide chain release factor 3